MAIKKSPTNPPFSHLWKVEKVEAITLETKCRPEEGHDGKNNYSLKLTVELDGEKSKKLLQQQGVSVGAEVEFRADGDWKALQAFRGSDRDVELKVTTGEQEPNLKLELTKGEPLYGGGYGWERVEKNFVCRESGFELVNEGCWRGGKNVFVSEMLSLGNRRLMNSGIKPISFSVSLKKCSFERGGKTITCDLKLTTGSDLKD